MASLKLHPKHDSIASDMPGETTQELTLDLSDIKTSNYTFSRAIQSVCEFGPDAFDHVMDNLILNPNITSSHLFRADIFWDSEKDTSFSVTPINRIVSSFLQHMKRELQPVELSHVDDFKLKRTLVRKLIPRNTKLDRALVQTCHFYRSSNESHQSSLVVYIPHAESVDEIPWYHPPVKALAFLHSWRIHPEAKDSRENLPDRGNLSIHLSFFMPGPDLGHSGNRLQRTLQNLLQTILKHGDGHLQGYKKRVHHDAIIPQAKLQDTYTRLKNTHAKILLHMWSEQTDATKGVFEDLGIAAFLIEVWKDMYHDSAAFPGFVDTACGNGVLVYILIQEGYSGWGFDARPRKTWLAFPENVQDKLKGLVLVPHVFGALQSANGDDPMLNVHNGDFKERTFIVSNHADELTIWTPLLAYLNNHAPFLAIPCCSHDFSGARTRFRTVQATDSKSQPSAYSGLCSEVSNISAEVGYIPEVEMLRIPSTRNTAILGRKKTDTDLRKADETSMDERIAKVRQIIERQMNGSVTDVGVTWKENVEKLVRSKGRSH